MQLAFTGFPTILLIIPKFLLFGEIWTEILAKYYGEIISKVNIFCLLFNEAVQHS